MDPVRAGVLAHASGGVDCVAVEAVEGLVRADDGARGVAVADAHLERDGLPVAKVCLGGLVEM